MMWTIGQMRLGQETAVEHFLKTRLPLVDVYNPRFLRPNSWSNRPPDRQQEAYLFPRYLFLSLTVPWQELTRVPGLTLVLEQGSPVNVPDKYVTELRTHSLPSTPQGSDMFVALTPVYEAIAKRPNHERAQLLITMFDKDWTKLRGWGDIVQHYGGGFGKNGNPA